MNIKLKNLGKFWLRNLLQAVQFAYICNPLIVNEEHFESDFHDNVHRNKSNTLI